MKSRSIRPNSEFHSLSSTALRSIDTASDAPEPSHGPPQFLLRDLLAIRHNTKTTRTILRSESFPEATTSRENISHLQITSLITTNYQKTMVTFWLALAEFVAEKLVTLHADAYCRQLAWLYGRQLELLDMLDEAEKEGWQHYGNRDSIGDRTEDRRPESRAPVL
jgi:hypothetical protein